MAAIDSVTRTITVANVIENLRDRIILGEYPDGVMLTELALAGEYGTSRGTVRTAMQMLESEGLIETLANGRKRVCGITKQFVHDLYETRALLECQAVRTILQKDYVNFGPLYEAVDVFQKLSQEQPDVRKEERFNANDRFHKTLLIMSDNKPLLRCWNTIEPTIQALAKFNSNTLDPKTHSVDYVKSHSRLLELLVTKDSEIETELRTHIDLAKRDSLNGLRINQCI